MDSLQSKHGPSFTPRLIHDGTEEAPPVDLVRNMHLPIMVGGCGSVLGFYLAYTQTRSLTAASALAGVSGLTGYGLASLAVDDGATLQSKAVQLMFPLGVGSAIATPLVLALGERSFTPHVLASLAAFGSWFLRFELMQLLGAGGLLR
jgi:hypothetical protein